MSHVFDKLKFLQVPASKQAFTEQWQVIGFNTTTIKLEGAT